MNPQLFFTGRLVPVLCGALMVSGCAWLPPMEQDGKSVAIFDRGAPNQANEIGGLLRYAQHLRHLTDAALERELVNTQEALERSQDPVTRIRAALLLSHPTAPFRQEEQARRILTEVIQQDAGDNREFSTFAAYYLGLLEQRQDAGDSLRTARHELAREREQRHILQTQLEALKAIETTLEQREDQAGRAAPPPVE